MENRNLEINGKGSSYGGLFDYVTISGMGHIEGNLECKKLEINGSGRVDGHVVTKQLEINGKARIEGDVKATNIQINGMGRMEESVSVTKLEVNGMAKIEGKVKADSIYVNGRAKVEEDIESEYVEINGSITHEGMLSTEELKVRSAGATFEEVGATKVVIRDECNLFMKLIRVFRNSTTVEMIEADEINIEYTNVKKVYGQNVIIGPNCKVEKVEYSETLTVDDSSKVKEAIKIS